MNKNNNIIKHKTKKHCSDKNNIPTKNGRKPTHVQGELEMIKHYDEKKPTVDDIMELKRRMQSIYSIHVVRIELQTKFSEWCLKRISNGVQKNT